MQDWILDVLKQAIGTLLAIGIILITPIRDWIVNNFKLSFDKAMEDKKSLNERKKHTSKTIFDNRYGWIVVWAVISIVVACVVHLLFKNAAPYPCLEASWSAGDILTYISTVSLGLLAMWQNQKSVIEQIEQFEFSEKPQIQCYLSCYKTATAVPYLVLVTENVGKSIARNVKLKVTWPKGKEFSQFKEQMDKLSDTPFTLAPGAKLSTPITWEDKKDDVMDGTITVKGTYKYVSFKGEEIEDEITDCELNVKEFDLFNAINVAGGHNNGQTENAHAE